jgi:hypothetical protein
MAKIKKGILGGFFGSVGPVIGGSWKGISYILPGEIGYRHYVERQFRCRDCC